MNIAHRRGDKRKEIYPNICRFATTFHNFQICFTDSDSSEIKNCTTMIKLGFWRNIALMIAAVVMFVPQADACTGISLQAKDGSKIVARTMEWGPFVLPSKYVIVPRGFTQQAQTPSGQNGMKFTSRFGYVGISSLEDRYCVEGMNEMGMVAQLFYFPGYGRYEEYDPKNNAATIADIEFIPWLLGRFSTIAEMEAELDKIHITGYGHGFESVHWNVADHTGRQVVLEYIDGEMKVHENKIGVITNAPSFDWMMTNLNNYINIFAGNVPNRTITEGVELSSFGMGTASLGLPGDLTPPSRFVRAVFYKLTARQQEDGHHAALQAFQILNNFDIPVGAEFRDRSKLPDFMSATQWTTASDTKSLKFYYRTMNNSAIRCIDMKQIDFNRVKFQAHALDRVKEQPVEYIKVQ